MAGDFLIRSIGIDPDTGITFDYLVVPDDIRHEGRLIGAHSMTVALCDEYADEIEALMDAAKALLVDALEDFKRTDPVVLTDDDLGDDDDD